MSTKYAGGLRMVYWKRTATDSVSASVEEATHVVVSPDMGSGYPEFTFELPAQRSAFEDITRFAARMVKFGRIQKAAELRAALTETTGI